MRRVRVLHRRIEINSDARGERQISLEGNAANPRFTRDGKKLCYLVVKEAPNTWAFYRDPGELRVADIESGRSEPLVSGLKVLDYDLSRDGSLYCGQPTAESGWHHLIAARRPAGSQA